MLPEAYEDGRCAAFDGERFVNPHQYGTADWQLWQDGYTDACLEMQSSGFAEQDNDDAIIAALPTVADKVRSKVEKLIG